MVFVIETLCVFCHNRFVHCLYVLRDSASLQVPVQIPAKAGRLEHDSGSYLEMLARKENKFRGTFESKAGFCSSCLALERVITMTIKIRKIKMLYLTTKNV
jgi:hypothetical protein